MFCGSSVLALTILTEMFCGNVLTTHTSDTELALTILTHGEYLFGERLPLLPSLLGTLAQK